MTTSNITSVQHLSRYIILNNFCIIKWLTTAKAIRAKMDNVLIKWELSSAVVMRVLLEEYVMKVKYNNNHSNIIDYVSVPVSSKFFILFFSSLCANRDLLVHH